MAATRSCKLQRSASAIDHGIGRRMKAARLEAGLSQQQMAEGLGVTFQQLQKYESGLNRMAASRLHRAGKLLGRPMAWFLGEADSAGGVARLDGDAADALATEEGLALIKAFATIRNLEGRRRVVKVVEALAADSLAAAQVGASVRGSRAAAAEEDGSHD